MTWLHSNVAKALHNVS